jgi:UDP-glucose 4-epimerase
MNQLLKGEPMTVFGDGEQQRAFTHINDVAPVIAGCVNVPAARNQVFNVGADVPFSVNQLAQIVAHALERECKVKHLDPRKEVVLAFSDHGKADRVFGNGPKTSLEDGIARMAKWVHTNGARESSVFENIEIPKNLPSSWARVLQKS